MAKYPVIQLNFSETGRSVILQKLPAILHIVKIV